MASIENLLFNLIGEPTTPLEHGFLYATECITFLVVFDTVLGLFRAAASALLTGGKTS
jgi:hypothetical protein